MITGYYIRCRHCRKFYGYMDQVPFTGITYSTPAMDRVVFVKDIENAHVYDRVEDARETLKNIFNNRASFQIVDSKESIVFEPG